MNIEAYNHVRSGGSGFHKMSRGLIAVWGKEAVQFLDGMITNDMKTLEDGAQMLAAFPNAQGRLIAVVRVLRQGDRCLFETEAATREVLYNSLFRFTFAGDFFVEDLSEAHAYYEVFGPEPSEGAFVFDSTVGKSCFIPADQAKSFEAGLAAAGAVAIDDETYETLRIESGIPKFGVDMDETTIVPELSLDGMISYNKGCYVGQEIIARIHFRGHVAKQLTGIVVDPAESSDGEPTIAPGTELTTPDGKNAGRITSVTFSPKLDKTIALGFVRYAHIATGTVLRVNDKAIVVTEIPLVN